MAILIADEDTCLGWEGMDIAKQLCGLVPAMGLGKRRLGVPPGKGTARLKQHWWCDAWAMRHLGSTS
ncbi:hypothetical protein Q3G72_018311 [Acer saccharum]|nr:hypothetical protein Q3G72_018311 [Acer saccharum]